MSFISSTIYNASNENLFCPSAVLGTGFREYETRHCFCSGEELINWWRRRKCISYIRLRTERLAAERVLAACLRK